MLQRRTKREKGKKKYLTKKIGWKNERDYSTSLHIERPGGLRSRFYSKINCLTIGVLQKAKVMPNRDESETFCRSMTGETS